VSLKTKLLLAQAPLAIVLVLVGVLSATVTGRLGTESRLILADNYRSVLAAQRMKEALERVDSNALYMLAGHVNDASAGIARNRDVFEAELRVQEGNITETGETEITSRLRTAWDAYRQAIDVYRRLDAREQRDRAYFGTVQPAFMLVKKHADEILALNQDTMVRKSDRAAATAKRFERIVTAAVVFGAILGLLASTWLIARTLRPLGVVAAAVRRFGEGDLRARADVRGEDEIAAVAAEVNRMAERLEQYRASSLGELLQAQQGAQAAIDGLPDPVLLLDASGHVQGANAAAGRLLGVAAERAGDEAYARTEPGVRAVIDRLRAHVLGGKGPYVPVGFEEALRVASTPEGERVFIPRAMPLYGESGAVTGAALIIQDVTRLFRFDELRSDLVATVAHEFRTPLTSLRMALHLCTEEVVGPLTPKQSELLHAAREDCERLQTIVDDLLNLARLESGRIDLHKRRVEPKAIVDGIIDVHRAAAEQASLTLRSEVFPSLPEVFADPDRLQLVFSNLVTNAIRHSPAGAEIVIRAIEEPTREAASRERSNGHAHVRFEIADRGPGIPSEHQAGLFEKFVRVPGSPEGGSGLGLFIAKGLVQAHGGEIGIDSEAGRGATFWFTIPVVSTAG
jgi:two-component system, NtrC family, sensor histidine kinase KinB